MRTTATIIKNIYKYHGILNLKTSCSYVLSSSKFNLVLYINHSSSVTSIHTSSICSLTRKQEIARRMREKDYVSPRKRKKVIETWEGMTVADLAKAMEKDIDDVFEIMTFVRDTEEYKHPDDVLAWDVMRNILRKSNLRFKTKEKETSEKDDHDVYPLPPADESKLKPRPPVVTIMGHVDHGKTTLLDYLRKSAIVKSEFGGITQHIGAFSVKVKSSSITFLDTPGHAAFKAMRSRGAHCTDIVILVVAADDGVMEQTEESIRMAKNAQVPIIVAINKIDKRDADVDTTKRMLMIQGLVPEDYGGDVQCVPISALKGTNVDALIEAINVQAEISNFRADPTSKVEGVIIESKVDTHRGKLATVLVRRGTLKKNSILTAGTTWGKVKMMYNEYKQQLHIAPPSTPVEVLGWKELPIPGDIIIEVESEKRANQVKECREKKKAEEKAAIELKAIEKKRQEHNTEYKEMLLQKRRIGVKKLKPGPREKEAIITWDGPILSIIIRSDVEGSLEAILDILYTYYDQRCKLDIIHSEVGNVTLTDVELAHSFNAIIYNFNTDVLPDAYAEAEKKNISIRPFNVIYKFVEDVKKELNARLPPQVLERVTAEAEVQKIFYVTDGKQKNVPVAGCRCTIGDLKKNSIYKIVRDGVEIHRGPLYSMRNLKTEVTSVKKDQECGLRFKDTSIVFKPGDLIQSFETYTVPEEIKWNPF